jgi:hypothetical protein
MPDARELLCCCEPCRAGADDSDFLAGLVLATCGAIQPSSQPLSTMKCSIDLMPPRRC